LDENLDERHGGGLGAGGSRVLDAISSGGSTDAEDLDVVFHLFFRLRIAVSGIASAVSWDVGDVDGAHGFGGNEKAVDFGVVGSEPVLGLIATDDVSVFERGSVGIEIERRGVGG